MAVCLNTLHGYDCVCEDGWIGNGFECIGTHLLTYDVKWKILFQKKRDEVIPCLSPTKIR